MVSRGRRLSGKKRMENVTALVIVAGVACLLVILALLNSTRAELARTNSELQRQSVEAAALAGQIETRARVQLEAWQQSELLGIRAQQAQIAQREALSLLVQWKRDEEKTIRLDAASRSQSVTTGKITEQMLPYFPGFPFTPKDCRFVGSPIDFVVFNGLSDGDVTEVVVLEVKTANSALTKREKQVREAIVSGRVRWEELRRQVNTSAAGQVATEDNARPTGEIPIVIPDLSDFSVVEVRFCWSVHDDAHVEEGEHLCVLFLPNSLVALISPVPGHLAIKLEDGLVKAGDTIGFIRPIAPLES